MCITPVFVRPFRTDSCVRLQNRLHPDQKAPSDPDGKSTRYFCRLHTGLHTEQSHLRLRDFLICKILGSSHSLVVSAFLPKRGMHPEILASLQ